MIILILIIGIGYILIVPDLIDNLTKDFTKEDWEAIREARDDYINKL